MIEYTRNISDQQIKSWKVVLTSCWLPCGVCTFCRHQVCSKLYTLNSCLFDRSHWGVTVPLCCKLCISTKIAGNGNCFLCFYFFSSKGRLHLVHGPFWCVKHLSAELKVTWHVHHKKVSLVLIALLFSGILGH